MIKVTLLVATLISLQACSQQQVVNAAVGTAKLPVKAVGAVAGSAGGFIGGTVGGVVAGNTGRRIGHAAGQSAARKAIP